MSFCISCVRTALFRCLPTFLRSIVPFSAGFLRLEGLDLVEPDVVISKDGAIVCLHDIDLSTVTDVASKPEFAGRKRDILIGAGPSKAGWSVSGA